MHNAERLMPNAKSLSTQYSSVKRLALSFMSYTKWLIMLVMIGTSLSLQAQYYLTGSVTDNTNTPLPLVKMRLKSSNVLYQSGSSGGFGIPSSLKQDWVTCYADGFDTLRVEVKNGTPNLLVMMPVKRVLREQALNGRLSSLTKNLVTDASIANPIPGESYSEVVENGWVATSKYPSTGFSPNTNNASYSNIRRFLNNQSRVPSDAVRIEEMLNYFSLSIAPTPAASEMFSTDTRITDCPWNKRNLLLFVNARARKLDLKNTPPANLVFLIDNSASMDMPNRLPLLQYGFKMLVQNLRDTDRVAIVTYGGAAGIALPPTSGREKEKINRVIDEIVPGGVTPGSNGIQLAYELAMANPIPNGNNRVILATDGDFNIGITDDKALENLIEGYKNSGIYLTCLGVGMGNYKDSKIETLARHGNGNFAYLDKEQEAEKVLVKELTQNLYAVASDVTVHIDLAPSLINQYRLIGYDNRKQAIKESAGQLMGVEIGSGSSVMAVFEVEPKDSSAAWRSQATHQSMGSVNIRYKQKPDSKDFQEKKASIPFNYTSFTETDAKIQFATAVAMFGGLLKRSPFTTNIRFEDIATITAPLSSVNNLQTEFSSLVEKANLIYHPEKKKKKGK